MKKCYKCGQDLGNEDLFCAFCGTKVEEDVEDRAESEEKSYIFCHNCGEKLEKDTMFCSNCGIDLRVEPQKNKASVSAPKKLSPKVVGVLAVAVVVILGAVLVNGLFRSPAKTFVTYQKELLLDSAMPHVVALAEEYNTLSSLSTDMTLTAEVSDYYTNQYLEDSSVGLKVDLNQDNVLLNADLTLMGSKVLNGAFSYDKGTVGFYLPELDGTYYTMDVGVIDETMFWNELGGLRGLEIPKIDTKTMSALAECYLDVVLGAANKDNVTISDKKSFRLDQLRTTLDGKVYVLEPTEEDIEEMLLKLADTLEKDKELRSFVMDFLGSNKEWISKAIGNNVENELDYELGNAADYLRDHARQIARIAEDEDFRWILGVSGGKVCMERIEMENGELVLAYERKDNDYVCYVSSYDQIQGSIELQYEKNGKTYDGEVAVSDGYNKLTMEFEDINRQNKSALGLSYGSYEFWVSNDSLHVKLNIGKAKNGGTDHRISAEYVYLPWIGYVDEAEMIINTTDKGSTASVPNAVKLDISNYDYYEMQDLFYELGEELEEIGYEIYRQY